MIYFLNLGVKNQVIQTQNLNKIKLKCLVTQRFEPNSWIFGRSGLIEIGNFNKISRINTENQLFKAV